ncbi:RNA polymerase II subunit A C-terminal domain phosphatase-like [Penaeus monodon]|uniref:RNA polymerase II subunit A C-terminal domain phosphatase-like n=1 Tax=Penaeus monodon TaxID=6687 RepID=UPI0018A72ABA|nr:RNA polymerase II subunit A C-terminal domain phosphatase-like [Penaeus monodon]
MLYTKETFRELDAIKKTGLEYKVTQIFLKIGTSIYPRRRLCEVVTDSGERVVVKAKHSGVVKHLLIKIDDVVKDGSDLVELEACAHPTLMGNICCDCGVVLEDNEITKTEVVSMLHTVPDLKIKKNVAEELGKEDITNLLAQRKLVLLVDLDQTLIHTTNDNIPPNLKDVYHFQINTGGPWYHTRLRPHTKQFLEKVSKYFELHICTFGVREYAHYIAHFLDPDHKLFGQRILSRNECLDQMSKKANLSSLFPCGDNLVCIIDDRSDVWNYSPNVIQVVPYHFFRHTGDINAPQGLQKKENDDQKGYDFENLRLSRDNTEVSDGEEGDKKNYSSDSDSDKETKDIVSDSNKDTGVNADQTSDKLENVNTENVEGSKSNDVNNKTADVQDTSIVTNKEKDEGSTDVQSNSVESMNVDTETRENGTKEEADDKENADLTDNKESEERKSSKETDITEETKVKNQDADDGEAGKQKDFIDVADNDDFLLYLEDILKKIHRAFFKEYDKLPQAVQKKITDLLNLYCMNYGILMQIVTPNWLWTCAERWERVEERLFPLSSETEKDIQRLPPHHCYCPDNLLLRSQYEAAEEAIPGPSSRTRTPSGSMLEDVNPLMFFSPDEKNNMANEVEQILSDESDDDDGPVMKMMKISPSNKKFKEKDQDSNSQFSNLRSEDEKEEDSPLPSEVFRQGGGLPSDDSDEGMMDDEGDLSRMGADLESLLD